MGIYLPFIINALIYEFRSAFEHQLAILQTSARRNLPTRIATVSKDRDDIQGAYSAISHLINTFLVSYVACVKQQYLMVEGGNYAFDRGNCCLD